MITNQNKHQKHGKTVKATFGEFGRLEIGMMGTPCGNIKQLAGEVIKKLNPYQLAYVDADHKTSDEEIPQYIKQGSTGVYTNKIEFHRLDLNKEPNKFERNGLFNEYDLVIINGNHFTANAQLLVIDEKKPLEKKLDKITNPKAIFFTDTSDTIPNYLKDKFPDIEKLPQFSLSQAQNISDFIKEYIKSNRPSLNGLVLSGGKSTRMQRDKSVIDYHGLPPTGAFISHAQ